MEITPAQFKQRFKSVATRFSNAEDLQALLQHLDVTQIAAGTRLIARSDLCSTLYLVWDGSLSISFKNGDAEMVLGNVGPGEWMGEVALLDPAPAITCVTAALDTNLLALSHEQFATLRKAHPNAASALLHALSTDMAERLRTYASRARREYRRDAPEVLVGHTEDKLGTIELLRTLMGIAGETP
ncbi:MAG: cyclic nucleotide-binding domain-containing protein [Burkholderiales bacterium]|nr:cyclic nucleotide-binding domain-containing protein [Burkholderiales bacterium]